MQLTFNAGLAQLGERQTEDLEVLSSILRDRIDIFCYSGTLTYVTRFTACLLVKMCFSK